MLSWGVRSFLLFLCLGEWEEVLGGSCVAEGMKGRDGLWEPLGDDRDFNASGTLGQKGPVIILCPSHPFPPTPDHPSSLPSSPESFSD